MSKGAFEVKNGLNFKMPESIAHDAGSRGLYLGAEHVLGVAVSQVPFEEGDLSRTGAASVDDLTAAVSFDDADYAGQAVDQHENMSYHHDGGRNAKFLELPFASEQSAVQNIISTALRKALS